MNGIKVDKSFLEKGQARLYRKKSIDIFARQINQTFWVESKEGNHQGKEKDYLLQDIKGELYIYDKEIFEEIYILTNP